MAEIRLTAEQQKVVDARDCNLLVAAAAGSGKTAVLVRRIIEKVLDKEHPQDIDRLLIVTFTDAAAAEMRERIGKAIEDALAEEPENKHLQRQMMLLHNSHIMTIHSFCLSVIREFFHVLSADPGFRIGDDAELSLLRSDVFEEVLEEYYEKSDADFLRFVESFAGVGKEAQVIEYGEKLYHLASSQVWPEEWLTSLEGLFDFSGEDAAHHPMFADAMTQVRGTLDDCDILVGQMLKLCNDPDGPLFYKEAIECDRTLLQQLRRAAVSYPGFASAIEGISFETLSRKKHPLESPEKKSLVKALRDTVKDLIRGLAGEYFYAPAEEMLSELQSMAPAMRGLISFTLSFMKRYATAKKEKNLIDYTDMEQMALKILVKKDGDSYVPTAEARVIAARFDEIMIDEYQDSNRIQETVFGSVSGIWEQRPNIFMVGDVKQSIYRFRMACPDLFMEKYRTYEDDGAYRKIDLHKNFRSRSCVLGAINALFAGLMHADSTEVEYDDAAALYYGADYPEETGDYLTEVLLVPVEELAEESSSEEDGAAEVASEGNSVAQEDEELGAQEKNRVRAEALAVARRMKELKNGGFLVGGRGKQRPVEYQDMVVLLRTMRGWSEQFLEVFAEQGIPAYADTSTGYFKSFEIRKTLDFLRILDNPKQDIPFAAVLHSPIAGFDAKELANLRIRYGRCAGEEKKQHSLYIAARKTAEAEPEGKAARFFALYDRLAKEAQYVSIHELIEHFYRYSGFMDIVTVMPGGERRRGNLEMLIAKAKQYESTSFSGLYDFIRYVDKLIKYDVDFGEAQVDGGGNMVRVMSIHKSKGLEFPVVFLCGMDKKFNFQDMRKRLVFHAGRGLGPEFVDTELRIKAPTLLKKTTIAHMKEELIAEELRVLYVALTRAKEKLVLVGAMNDPEKRKKTWETAAMTVGNRGLLATYAKKAATYFDFICPLLFAGAELGDGTWNVERMVNGVNFAGRFRFAVWTGTNQAIHKAEEWMDREERLQTLTLLAQEDNAPEDEVSLEIRELLRQQEHFAYAFDGESKLPVKVTVSELKRLHLEEMEEAGAGMQVQQKVDCETEEISEVAAVTPAREDSYPEFLQEKKEISGSDRGTLYHYVMEQLPMERDLTKEDITAFLDLLVAEGKLRQEEREAVFEWKIHRFTESELGRRMKLAKQQGKLRTEQPFVVGIPAKEVYAESESKELILVQGIIDAFFEEGDDLVLMDYKTDFVKTDAKTELTAKYQVQLNYYRRALEKLLGKSVKETWIYSFYAGEGFRLF